MALTVEQLKNIRAERLREMTVAEMKGQGAGQTDVTDTRNNIRAGEYSAIRTSSIANVNYGEIRG